MMKVKIKSIHGMEEEKGIENVAVRRELTVSCRMLTNIALDDMTLKKNGEPLEEKGKRSKRKKSKSLKRLGLTEGDAITISCTNVQNPMAAGDEEKLRTALLSLSIRSRGDGGVAASLTHDISTWELPIKVVAMTEERSDALSNALVAQDIKLHNQRLGSGSYGSVFKVCESSPRMGIG